MPGLNEILDARGRGRSFTARRWDGYNALKRKWMAVIVRAAKAQAFHRVEGGRFTYLFVEPDKRRDPSNIVSGGIKIIEDALISAELLPGDGWRHVASFRPYWMVRPEKVGALVAVHPDESLKKRDMLDAFERLAWRPAA